MESTGAARRVPWRIKLWYAGGQAGESIKNFGFTTLLFIYYNQVLGLSGTWTGIGVAIALVADAVSDPAVGSWSDGYQSRWGRRHPFMLWSILPLSLFFFALFWPPAGLEQFELFLWFTTFSVLLRTALTFFHVPYLSLGAELSQDYQERTQIVAVRTVLGSLASLGVAAIAWNFFFVSTPGNPTPQLTREPYFLYALLGAAVMGVALFASTIFTAPAIERLAGSAQAPRRFSVRQVYVDLFEALRNQSFRALFLGTLIYFVYSGTHGALAMHLKTFFWTLDTVAIQWWQYAAIVGGVLGVPFAPLFNRWLDKKWTVIVGVLGAAVAGTGPVLLALVGLMPDDPAVLVPLLVGLAFAGTFVGVQAAISVASMMGDIADEHELHRGTRQEGIYFGSYSFSQKCTGALGNMLAGFAIDLIGLDPNTRPGEVSEAVLFDFGLTYVVIASLLVLSTWIFFPYSLDRKRHAEIVDTLGRRRRGEAAMTADERTAA
jgi:Na+/melibiose symporter-like transporter